MKMRTAEKVSKSKEATKEKIHSMGLPASIEDFEKTSDEGIPRTQLEENENMCDFVEKKLRSIESLLTQANVCRRNYGGTKWSRSQSTMFSQDFVADSDRYKGLVMEAKTSDGIIRENQDKTMKGWMHYRGQKQGSIKNCHSPDLFMKRVEANGDWSLFCLNEATGLYECSGDEFEKLYEQYEKDGRSRKNLKAQQLCSF
ncbi:hypothetical protein PsorP6_013685 [Peronosclerospora sorghi]|uniref:Uncharacterized protein n=1 Tax=Peronosclerospora sorghi TaxID=230839 RepID=A0ACC0VGM7_9STRA|nr:hypothetical protein PsorP6_013685 [Peronosclerospora sorghi]